jgi:AAA+ superfamily predicted ATPase
VTITIAPHRDSEPTAALTRSQRVSRELNLASAGNRGVLLTGHTSDVLIAPDGALVRQLEWLATWAAQTDRDLLVLDERTVDGRPGGRMVSPPGRTPNAPMSVPSAALPQLLTDAVSMVRRSAHPMVILVDYCCLHLDRDDGEMLRLLAEIPLDAAFSRGRHLLILAFPTRAPRELTSLPGWAVVDIGLPDVAERRHIFTYCDQRTPVPLNSALTLDKVATNLGGLSADALLRLVVESREHQPLTNSRIAEVKSAEIRRLAGGTLTVESQTRPMSDLAGLANLRLYLAECAAAATPPGVILLAGPPGTGKTRSFLAVADHLGLPAVRLGQLRSRYVGDSENNWATARRVLEATAPSCVLLDEADQTGLGHRSSDLDSGVSARLRAELWDWLNNCTDLGITVIATTNNPTGLDPASLDRVMVLPVLHPTPTEAAQIMAIEARRAGLILDENTHVVLAAHTGLFTGRQVVRLLNHAARGAAMAGHRGHVTTDDLATALANTLDVGDEATHELMALSALLLADSRSAWPWVSAARLGETGEGPRYITGLLDNRGDLDLTRLRDRIDQLRQISRTP